MAKKKHSVDVPEQQLLFSEQEGPRKHPITGSKQSAEHIHKRSESLKRHYAANGHNHTGTKLSEEHKAKIRAAKKGKGNHITGRPVSEETRRKIGAAHKGHKRNLGRKHTAETRRKQSKIAKDRGISHNFRVDGKGDERRIERKRSMQQLEYRFWREAVFERDDWTCQICGKRGSIKLHADHIKTWRDHSELRYDVSNGRTLCVDCHKKTPTFGRKAIGG